MLRKTNPLLKIFIFSLVSSTAIAESLLYDDLSALRVACDGADKGAKIYVNGQYKVDCPSDIFLPSGSIKLRVVKSINEEYERVYEEEFYLADNVPKKVEVQLSGRQLSAVGRKIKQRREKEAATAALEKAKSGDITSMKVVAKYYEQGKGLPQNSQSADEWHKRAQDAENHALAAATLKKAKSGDVQAMRNMSQLYATGRGVAKNNKSAQEWMSRADALAAKAALENAKKGDVDAMRELSGYYAEGKGIEKNAAQSQSWAKKAQAKADEQQRNARQAKINREAQEALDKVDFLHDTKYMFNSYRGESFSYVVTSGPIGTLSGIASDVIMTPFNLTKVATLKARMASRPSTFGKPDSMIAKAHSQRELAGH